jgi:UDP-N-acetylglucosamine 2-epimerase
VGVNDVLQTLRKERGKTVRYRTGKMRTMNPEKMNAHEREDYDDLLAAKRALNRVLKNGNVYGFIYPLHNQVTFARDYVQSALDFIATI